MIELYENIPVEIKQQLEQLVDLTFKTFNLFQAKAFFKSYIESCQNEEEKDFLKFLVTLKMETYNNENNND